MMRNANRTRAQQGGYAQPSAPSPYQAQPGYPPQQGQPPQGQPPQGQPPQGY